MVSVELSQRALRATIGRVVPEYGDPLRRELIHSPYRIIYRVFPEKQKVEILAVVHSARLLVQ